jgi:poly(3-hydroxybutyrate) depolymerase
MDFLAGKGMRRTAILWIFILLAGCTPEKPVITPAVVVSKAVPELTAQGTIAEVTSQVTPSPIVTEDCARGDYFDEIESGGQTRQYILHVPARYKPGEPAALVLVFHGAGIGAERFVSYTRFSTVADREGFLIVYPQGLGKSQFGILRRDRAMYSSSAT